MKHFTSWVLALVALLIMLVISRTPPGEAAPPGAVATQTPIPPVRTVPPDAGDIPALTDGQPIHMPDLLGQSLEYAMSIWDEDDGLAQITVRRLNNDPNLIIVRQEPAPGTLIVPERTRVVLDLGRGPIVRPRPSPTPLPRIGAMTALAGQATLLRQPYVQNVTTVSLTIVWTTVEDGASQVQYGISDYSLTAPATSTFFTTPTAAPYDQYFVHEATLTGLTPDTVYQYKIFTNGVDLTPGGSVTVRSGKPATTAHFRFAAFGDSGDGSQNQKDVATRLLQVQPDLAVHTGDVIYPEATYDGFETKYFQIYKDLLKSIWLAPSAGNHDMSYNNGKSFADVFVNPPNPSSDPVQRELYYSFDYGNAHFVILDNFLSYTPSSSQYNWLQNDLAASNQFWKFVIFHVPPYASDSNQLPRDNTNEVRYLVPLFEQYGVDIVLNGHWHLYERMYPLLGGQVSTIEAGGVVYVVTGGGGAGLAGAGTGTLNPRTAYKVSKFHLTLFDVNGCSLQLAAVHKVSGANDTFDPSDVFDSYTIDRCGGTPSPTNTPTATATATFGPSPTPTNTPTSTPTPTATVPGTSARIKDITFEDGLLTHPTSGVDSDTGAVALDGSSLIKGVYSADIPSMGSAYLNETFSGVDDLYVSFYLKVNSLPTADVRLALISNSGTTVGNVLLRTTGALRLRNGSTTLGVDTVPLTVGALYRVGLHQRRGTGGNAMLEAYLAAGDNPFGAPFASTTTGTWTTPANLFRFGATTSTVLDATFDDIRLDSGSMPGPSLAGPTPTPTATATFGPSPTSTTTPTSTLTHTPTNTPTATATATLGPSPTPTNTRTSTPTPTNTRTPTPTPTRTNTPTSTPTSTATIPGTSARIKDITFEDGLLTHPTSGVDSVAGAVALDGASLIKGVYAADIPSIGSAYLNETFTGVDDLYVSFYLKVNSLPTADVRLALISNSGTTVGNVLLRTTGALRLRNGSTTLGVDTVPLTVGALYRVGLHQRRGTGGNAMLEAYLAAGDNPFGAPFASTTTGTWTTPANLFRFGATTSTVLDATFDDIRLDSGSMPGASFTNRALSSLRLRNTILPAMLGFAP